MAQIKFFDRDELIDAATTAVERGYNRAVSVSWLIDNLDDGMYYPVTFAMIHEHIAGQPAEPHMRTLVVINAEGERITLDVDMKVYRDLSVVDIDFPFNEVANAQGA